MLKALQSTNYGTVFWDLPSGQAYVGGVQLFCKVFVYNPTSVDRNYMLQGKATRGEATLSQVSITVNNQSWFTVPAGDILAMPGVFTVDYTDVAFILELVEEETGEVVDSISTALTSSGTEQYPVLPGLPGQIPSTPTTDVMNLMLPIIMLMMLGTMMVPMFKKRSST